MKSSRGSSALTGSSLQPLIKHRESSTTGLPVQPMSHSTLYGAAQLNHSGSRRHLGLHYALDWRHCSSLAWSANVLKFLQTSTWTQGDTSPKRLLRNATYYASVSVRISFLSPELNRAHPSRPSRLPITTCAFQMKKQKNHKISVVKLLFL